MPKSWLDIANDAIKGARVPLFSDAQYARLMAGVWEGAAGPPGVDWVWLGDWDTATLYFPGDIVASAGSIYIALTTNHASAPPSADWDVVIAAAVGGAGSVPVGGILMWSGLIANIPATWAFCDGTLNAPGPDLRDKFVVGGKQDSGGVVKTNIEGALSQSGGATGHLHSAHANLTHAGGAVADHTGLTHSLAIANHPDLTHAALSHAASTFSHPDHSIASVSHTHAAVTVTPADLSVPSFTGSDASGTFSVPSGTFSVPSGTFASHTHASSAVGQASLTLSISSAGTARTIMTGSSVTIPSFTGASGTVASSTGTVASSTGTIASQSHTHAAITLTHAGIPIASITGSHAATMLTHPDHSFPSLSHQAIGTHVGTTYGVHTITQPADHGTAGTLVHSFTQPNVHVLSLHDTVSHLPSYYALAYIQRMS